MTKLEAVNEILAAIGEDPVNSLDEGLPDADRARQTLDRVLTRTLTRGWWFNQYEEYDLQPDSEDQIHVPGDFLRFIPSGKDQGKRIIQRSGKLYDMEEQSHTFTDKVTVHATTAPEWEDLPQVFKDYVTVKAARHFQDDQLGSQKHHQYNIQDEQHAHAMLMEVHIESEPANMNRDSVSALEITGRFSNPSKYIP